MFHSIPADMARLGMFVADLDRPWMGTPFLMQGFLIDEQLQVEQLRAVCKTLLIDLSRSDPDAVRGLVTPSVALRDSDPSSDRLALTGAGQHAQSHSSGGAPRKLFSTVQPTKDSVHYAPNLPLRQAVKQASHSVDMAVRVLDKLSLNYAQGTQVDSQELDQAADTMVMACAQSADALLWVARLRKEANPIYQHCLIVSACMLAVGRHLGFAQDELKRLCLIGLLLDIGMLNIPQEILQRPGPLSEEDMGLVRTHVEHTQQLMAAVELDDRVLQGVLQHHERLDGSGYPQGLSHDEIGFYGRLAAIADVFAAITSERAYAAPRTPFVATRELFSLAKDRLYEPLVETFVQAVGIFPVGSLVELTTGEVAMVVRHNLARRLQPQLLVVMNSQKVLYPAPYELDLLLRDQDAQGNKLSIVRGLPSNAYGIDVHEFFLRADGAA